MKKLSIVIPTRNRDEVASELVLALLGQDYPAFEIIIVDQSDHEPVKLSALPKQDPRIHYLHLAIPGTCRARNAGVLSSTGDVIVFLDDDAVPVNTAFLRAHADAYDDSLIAGVAGRVLELNDDAAMRGPLLAISRYGVIHPNASGSTARLVDHARGGNMSFRKEWMDRVGQFDERFRGNAMREETDYSLRIREAGGRILFVPGATVEHRRHPTGGSRSFDRIQWYEDFFFNEALFFGKHFSRWKFPVLLLRKFRAVIACAVYYGHLSARAVAAPWKGLSEGLRVAKEPLP